MSAAIACEVLSTLAMSSVRPVGPPLMLPVTPLCVLVRSMPTSRVIVLPDGGPSPTSCGQRRSSAATFVNAPQ